MTNGEAVNWIINISADIGKAEYRGLWHYEQALSEIREILESAQPERKTGKWIILPPCFEEICMCSNCKTKFFNAYQHRDICPNCGAYMRGESE